MCHHLQFTWQIVPQSCYYSSFQQWVLLSTFHNTKIKSIFQQWKVINFKIHIHRIYENYMIFFHPYQTLPLITIEFLHHEKLSTLIWGNIPTSFPLQFRVWELGHVVLMILAEWCPLCPLCSDAGTVFHLPASLQCAMQKLNFHMCSQVLTEFKKFELKHLKQMNFKPIQCFATMWQYRRAHIFLIWGIICQVVSS